MKLELFKAYERHNMTPQRLVENYVARVDLIKDNAEVINTIIDYAVWLAIKKYKWEHPRPVDEL